MLSVSQFGEGEKVMKARWKQGVHAAICASAAWLLLGIPSSSAEILIGTPARPSVPIQMRMSVEPRAPVTPASLKPSTTLPPELAEVWQSTKLPDEALSLVVQEIGGPRLLAINADTPRNPASVMKLITTWAALSELGSDHVWRTGLLAQAGATPDAKGVLPGPLYVRAGGDPIMQIEDVWTMLRELRLRGIRQIGDVVVDRSMFGPVAIDPSAFDGSGDRAYNASPDAMVVGFGAVRLFFTPDPENKVWHPVMDPPLPGVTFEGAVQWSDVRCPGPPVVSTKAVPTSQGVSIQLSGKVAGSCGEFSLYRLVMDQPDLAAGVFRYLWTELGGTFTGKVREGRVPVDAVLLAQHESPALGDIIRVINKRSNNVMARMLLLALGAERGPRPATVASSIEVLQAVLAGQGLDMPELRLENGAGLSRVGQGSAASVVRMLSEAWNSPLMPEYVSSLSIVGVDGTLKRRLKNDPAQGMGHLKTGSLRDVRAIAGYVQGISGKQYVVASLVNHDRATAVRAFDDALVSWLSAH